MGKKRSNFDRSSLVRDELAHLAARIMAQDGIEDFAVAKRKAARQAGVPEHQGLPPNEDVENALRDYLHIYLGSAQEARLTELRKEAVSVMRQFERFRPYLTGPVLSGLVGRYTGISLQLFADSAKEVELFLLREGIRYTSGACRLFVNDHEVLAPTFLLHGALGEVRVVVLASNDCRSPIRTNQGGRAIQRAPLSTVEALLEE